MTSCSCLPGAPVHECGKGGYASLPTQTKRTALARPPKPPAKRFDEVLEAAFLAGFEQGYIDPMCTNAETRRLRYRQWRESQLPRLEG